MYEGIETKRSGSKINLTNFTASAVTHLGYKSPRKTMSLTQRNILI